jgi:hypothetical protein
LVAKPFYIQLLEFMCVLEYVMVPLKLQANHVDDVRWLSAPRSDALEGMPMARLARTIPPNDFIKMDASDTGVRDVWHSQMESFAIPWNSHEEEGIRRFKVRTGMNFSINYREL